MARWNELFIKLNDEKLSVKQVRNILNEVDVSEREIVMIGQVSVAQLLKLTEACKLEDLTATGANLSEYNLNCGKHYNKGAMKFFKAYHPVWMMSCIEEIRAEFRWSGAEKEAVNQRVD